MQQQAPEASCLIFDFNTPETSGEWKNIDDPVMGGRSSSAFTILPAGKGLFSGIVSLENNGGFASSRTNVNDVDFTRFSGIRLRVRGDGNTYSFRIRVDDTFDGISYRATFETGCDSWQEIKLPFDAFVPTFRGRQLTDVGPVQPDSIRQIGFLISDKQAGAFELRLDWIAGY